MSFWQSDEIDDSCNKTKSHFVHFYSAQLKWLLALILIDKYVKFRKKTNKKNFFLFAHKLFVVFAVAGIIHQGGNHGLNLCINFKV